MPRIRTLRDAFKACQPEAPHPQTPGQPRVTLVKRATAAPPTRLGVLGGAYNPITLAHLAIAEAAMTPFGIDEVLFLLPQVPPHKTIFGASLEQRLEMMRLAVDDTPHAAVGLSTHGLFVDMYEALLAIYPHRPQVYFLTGRDAAERILAWHYDDAEVALKRMFAAFQFIVCSRRGPFSLPDDPLLAPYRDRIHTCALPPQADAISATEVRQRRARGLPIDDLVPAPVAAYIAAHRLYAGASPMPPDAGPSPA
jgi:nicotinate (nicotinamide) nucleotide adenylyltransferase